MGQSLEYPPQQGAFFVGKGYLDQIIILSRKYTQTNHHLLAVVHIVMCHSIYKSTFPYNLDYKSGLQC